MIKERKKPGTDCLYAIRTVFGASVDWLLTGEGTMFGRNDIDLDLLRNNLTLHRRSPPGGRGGEPTAKALEAGHFARGHG